MSDSESVLESFMDTKLLSNVFGPTRGFFLLEWSFFEMALLGKFLVKGHWMWRGSTFIWRKPHLRSYRKDQPQVMAHS